jgi:autotransporter-associated beta strand protein
MKTPFEKTQSRLGTLSYGLVALCLCSGLQQSAHAQTTLNYTNAADAWLTTNSWTPANNWGTGTVKTNATTANVRLNIGTVSNRVSAVTYDASMGTTILDNTGFSTRGFVIGSGNGTTGTVTVAGGTLVIRNGNTTDGSLLVGSPGPFGAGQGTLTLSGGNLVFTNGTALMCIPFRGGSTNGGVNFSRGTFNINNGSTATIERVQFCGEGLQRGETGAQCTGELNLNPGGTLAARYVRASDNDASQMASIFNFNGGTLRVMTPVTGFNFIADAGTNLTVNVKAGGAMIDTAGTNATCTKPLLDAGGGGGLTKNGTGTLTLNQTNTYTGATVVNGGALSFILPMSSSALTLANGTTNTITVGNNSWANSVTSVTNATLNLALGAVTTVPTATTPVINTGSLNVSGTNVINITSGAGLTVGSVKLIDYTSGANRAGSGSFVLGTLPPGLQATLVDGPNDVSLNVTDVALIWSGNVSDNVWATNGVLNWDGGLSAYVDGDAVSFTDAGIYSPPVNLTNNVSPRAVIFDHTTASAVELAGTGQITGTNGLLKTGNGTTLLNISNSFSGVVAVNNGVLKLGNGGALGSTAGGTEVTGTGTVLVGDGLGTNTTVTGETITLDGGNGFGGTLGQLRGNIGSGTNVWAGPIVLGANIGRIGTENNGNLTVTGPITDNGNSFSVLYRPGDGGTNTAAGSGHSYGGTATFCGSGGIVKLGVNNGFSTNVLSVGTGTIDLNGFSQTVSGLGVFSGNGVILNNGAGTSTLTLNVTGTNGFAATASIQDGSQPISLIKEGTGRQSLNSPTAHTYTGSTVVNNGELRLGSTLGNTAVSVNAGALLSVNSAATVAGTITVNGGGTLSPGAVSTIGNLTNSSTVTLNAGSTNWFRVNATTSLSDLLVANTNIYGGTLVVTNVSPTPVTNGQVFQLVSATTPSGTFANAASVAILPGGTGSFNPATGQLTVTAVPATIPTAPTNITFTATSSDITISWPSNYLGWSLQTQTNSRSVGLKAATNFWFTIPGTESVTTTNLPVDKINETVFFRLFYAAP